jgi:hypothetical protein
MKKTRRQLREEIPYGFGIVDRDGLPGWPEVNASREWVESIARSLNEATHINADRMPYRVVELIWVNQGRLKPMQFLDRLREFERELGREACWPWPGKLNHNGYALICTTTAQLPGRKRCGSGHRKAYELLIGPIPEGLTLDHLCRVRHCVNPWHMEPVTNTENVLRGQSFTAKHAKKTHCPSGHPYSGENLRMYEGRRYCRACANEFHRKNGLKKSERKRAHQPPPPPPPEAPLL